MTDRRHEGSARSRHLGLMLHLSGTVCQLASRVQWQELCAEDRADARTAVGLLRRAASIAENGWLPDGEEDGEPICDGRHVV